MLPHKYHALELILEETIFQVSKEEGVKMGSKAKFWLPRLGVQGLEVQICVTSAWEKCSKIGCQVPLLLSCNVWLMNPKCEHVALEGGRYFHFSLVDFQYIGDFLGRKICKCDTSLFSKGGWMSIPT